MFPGSCKMFGENRLREREGGEGGGEGEGEGRGLTRKGMGTEKKTAENVGKERKLNY